MLLGVNSVSQSADVGSCSSAGLSLVTTLRRLWAEALFLQPTISLDTSFFELGGNSLLAMKLMNTINRKLRTAIPTSYLLEQRTLRSFVNNLNTVLDQSLESIPKVMTMEQLKLSPQQESEWAYQKLHPKDASLSLINCFYIQPGFHLPTFMNSLHRVVRRHQVLRSPLKETECGIPGMANESISNDRNIRSLESQALPTF